MFVDTEVKNMTASIVIFLFEDVPQFSINCIFLRLTGLNFDINGTIVSLVSLILSVISILSTLAVIIKDYISGVRPESTLPALFSAPIIATADETSSGSYVEVKTTGF